MRPVKTLAVVLAVSLGGAAFAAIPEELILDGWLDELISLRRVPQQEVASVIHFGGQTGGEPMVLFLDKLQFVVDDPQLAAASMRDRRALGAFRRMFQPGDEGLSARKAPLSTLGRVDQ